jgi:DNA-directed RNA polymerase subunit RPC12/RpoP
MSDVKIYKCLGCHAPLAFDPISQNWKCKYCFSQFTKEQLDASPLNQDEDDIQEQSVEEEQHKEQFEESMTEELDAYHCNNCGAELLADETTSATFCLYCKSPTIIKTRFSGRFKPSYVIPFKIDHKKAEELYYAWIRKRFFAPKLFKQKDEIEKITGIYAPFWMFNSKVSAYFEGQGTKVKTWSQGSYRYTNTRFYDVLREGQIAYSNIPVDGSIKLDDTLMELIEPFNYDELKPFSMQYMSGFMAERYDLELTEAEKVAKNRIEGFASARIRDTALGYTTLSTTRNQVQYNELNDDYYLMPIYLLNNRFKDKDHIFIINGQTGKVVGQTPISLKKQLLFGLGVFLVTWVVVAIGGGLIG